MLRLVVLAAAAPAPGAPLLRIPLPRRARLGRPTRLPTLRRGWRALLGL